MTDKNYAAPAGAFGCVTGKTGQMGGGQYERPGHTIQRIDEVRYHETRKNEKAVIIEKTILHVISAPKQFKNGKGTASPLIDMEQPYAGQKVIEFIALKQDYAGDALAAFLQTCFNVKPGTVQPEHVASACSPDQPCRGMILEVNSEEKPNRAETVTYVRTHYVRVVPARELANLLDDEGVKVLGGDDAITAMVQREDEASKA